MSAVRSHASLMGKNVKNLRKFFQQRGASPSREKQEIPRIHAVVPETRLKT